MSPQIAASAFPAITLEFIENRSKNNRYVRALVSPPVNDTELAQRFGLKHDDHLHGIDYLVSRITFAIIQPRNKIMVRINEASQTECFPTIGTDTRREVRRSILQNSLCDDLNRALIAELLRVVAQYMWNNHGRPEPANVFFADNTQSLIISFISTGEREDLSLRTSSKAQVVDYASNTCESAWRNGTESSMLWHLLNLNNATIPAILATLIASTPTLSGLQTTTRAAPAILVDG